MNILKIQNVIKKLGEQNILKGVNLNIKQGEIISLIGPSGSGKSTLLRCINRLIEVDEGTIHLKNQNIKEIPPVDLRRNVVLVNQESTMLSGTVYDNIAYGLKLQNKIDTKVIKESIIEAGLSDEFKKKNAKKLSGGEKKRVALARALALRPEVLLLDEPSAGIDPKKIQTIEKTIIDFSKKRKLTVVWVTHDTSQATRVSDRIANIKDGIIKNVQKTSKFQWEGAY